MFSIKAKNESADKAISSTSIIGTGTHITGNISTTGDVRIDGSITGEIETTAKLFIGPDGSIDGTVRCRNADIFGKVTGKIMVKELLQLKGKAQIEGDIVTGKLLMEQTASYNGICKMGASIIGLVTDMPLLANEQ